jgi:hypothetical protein
LCGGVAGFGGDFGLQIMQDQYINHIMTKTGTEVAVRGIGSGYLESFSGEGMHLQSISINTYRLVVHVWIVNQGHLLL